MAPPITSTHTKVEEHMDVSVTEGHTAPSTCAWMVNTIQAPGKHFTPLALGSQNKSNCILNEKVCGVCCGRCQRPAVLWMWGGCERQESLRNREDKWPCQSLPPSTHAAHSCKMNFRNSGVLTPRFLVSASTPGPDVLTD